ncbi:MAG TPA: hypothetical protein VG838_08145 [Opitutaceae bacterium]|nr:hypothetical protein [Opitutaceae bacterium]
MKPSTLLMALGRGIRSLLGKAGRPLLYLVAAALSLGWILALARQHFMMMMQPGPQELNEPAAWYATWLLDQGRNPYSVQEMPGSAQFFGPLYSYVVLALKPVLGIDYPAHRILNFVCILLTLWLLCSRMVRLGASRTLALVAGALLYWIFNQNILITARPDALGMLFFVAGIIIPWERGYRRWPVVIGLACAVLAFHCKAYFALSGTATLLGVACHRSKGEALAMGAGFFAAIFATIGIFMYFYPLYYAEVFVMQSGTVVVNSNSDILYMHTAMLVERAWPYLLILSFACAHFAARYDWKANLAFARAHWRDLRTPLTAQPLPVLGLVLIVHLVLMQAVMGRNGGATFTYHIHLLYPLFMLALAAYATTPRRDVIAVVLLAVCTQLNFELDGAPDSSPAYTQLAKKLEPYQNVLGIASTTEILARQGKAVHNDGFTIFVPCAFGGGLLGRTKSVDALNQRYAESLDAIKDDVINHRVDVIMTQDRWCYLCDMDTVRANYEVHPDERMDLPMRFAWDNIDFWYPKSPPTPATPPSPPAPPPP